MAEKKSEAGKGGEEAPEGAAEGVDLPKKKISGKKLVIIIAALLLLLGGVGGGLYYKGIIGPKKTEAAGEHGEEAAAEGEHGAEGGEGEHGEAKGPVYYEMPAILVNLTSTGRRPVYAKVRVNLVLAKETDREVVTANQPRIVDNFQTYLRELTPEEMQGSAGLVRLREELLLRVNSTVSPVVVKDLLFQEILPQ